jgi:O-antigen ligase
MSHGSKRTRSSRRTGAEFSGTAVIASQPLLVTATDVCLWVTLLAVAIGFGGRMASGQLALIIGASATALCWMIYQFTSSDPRYTWTGSEWLWGAGALVGIAQIVKLPSEWLLRISPQIRNVLPLWFDNDTTVTGLGTWNQLSLAPWETASGLATFASYALLFLVAAQRTRTVKDVERTLCLVALASVAMTGFALLQFLTSNGKFFWTYEHPYMTTDTYPLGCFTNRNHLAQFLALGTSPLIWWLLRRLQQQEQDRIARRAMPTAMHATAVSLLLAALGGIALTVLMTLSRGGLLAIGLTSCAGIAMMCRIGLASMKFGFALMLVGLVTGCLFSFSKYESILTGRLEQNSGRSEIWQANIEVARDFPILGTGVGTHSDAYQLHIDSRTDDGYQYSHAESGYLQVASESGLGGLLVAGLFIATSLWWCIGALWNPDTKASSAAAAILAGLIANILHAIGDFFWYTPACMLLLAIQLACASRLYRLARQDAGRFVRSFRLPRLVTAIAACGLVPLAVWMFDLKYPAAIADVHHIQSVRLMGLDERDLTDEEKETSIQQRLKEVLLAAKSSPRDAKLQEAATTAYIQLFDLKQEHSENTMSSSMLRDAVKSSQFETPQAAAEWLNRAVGSNLKLLRLAGRSLKRSLANGPLRAKSYVLLTELGFLDRLDDEVFQQRCLEQALRLRPHDADTLYLVGKSGMQEGNLEKALTYWRPAFERSPRMQERIATVLAGQMSPDFFEQEFHPEWKSLEVIGRAFAGAGRLPEAQQVQRLFVTKGLARTKGMTSDEELEATLIAVRNTCHELGDINAAVNVMTRAVKRLPHSYSIRYMLGLDLVSANRPADAAEHLKWCASRQPNDASLQRLAGLAVTERLKQTPAVIGQGPQIEQMGLRR